MLLLSFFHFLILLCSFHIIVLASLFESLKISWPKKQTNKLFRECFLGFIMIISFIIKAIMLCDLAWLLPLFFLMDKSLWHKRQQYSLKLKKGIGYNSLYPFQSDFGGLWFLGNRREPRKQGESERNTLNVPLLALTVILC